MTVPRKTAQCMQVSESERPARNAALFVKASGLKLLGWVGAAIRSFRGPPINLK